MNILMIVTDLGRMKAFRITRDEDDPTTSPAFTDVADEDPVNWHSRVSDRMTDQAGRFPTGSNGMSIGEQHSEEQEARKQQLATIAGCIHRVAGNDDTTIYLAAPPTMTKPLLGALPENIRRRIGKHLELDLVKAPKLDLLERFGLA